MSLQDTRTRDFRVGDRLISIFKDEVVMKEKSVKEEVALEKTEEV